MKAWTAIRSARRRLDERVLEWRADHQDEAVCAARWHRIVPVSQPLLLVSQIQRSGGTLFTRLLDGHPECLSHPYELQWASKPSGPPAQAPEWPRLDPAAPVDEWWRRLTERWITKFGARGYLQKARDRQPLAFVPDVHRRLFFSLWRENPPSSRREVFNHYFTALFNAWADCAGVYAAPKGYVVAFAPQVHAAHENVRHFWHDYPDGLCVSIIRSPDRWMASALPFRSSAWKPGDAADAIRQWKASVRASLDARAHAPDRTLIISFEALVQSPAVVMDAVCDAAGLARHAPWVPSFNGRPVLSNSSVEPSLHIDPAAVTRPFHLTADVRELLDKDVWDLHAAAMAVAHRRSQVQRVWSFPVESPLRPGPGTPRRRQFGRRSGASRRVFESRLKSVSPVTSPILLISQIQRSGGTLLSRLFDGHPECHAHPHELTWGSPSKRHWPDLPMQAAGRWWRLLTQRWQLRTAATGTYHKQERAPQGYPMVLHRRLQAAIWRQCLEESPPTSQRDVLNASLTAFFHAWLDYQGWSPGVPKRYVTAFTPGVTTTAGSLDRYWHDYADGHVISLVRDPMSWYASARIHRHGWRDLGSALTDWEMSARAAVEAHAARPDRVTVILFDDLVDRTSDTMAHLCRRTGLTPHPSLLTPTFNTMPIVSNSNFVPVIGLDPNIHSRSALLTSQELADIQARCGDLYADVTKVFRLT